MAYMHRQGFSPEERKARTEKDNEIQEERKKFPDRHPKRILHQDGTRVSYFISGRYDRQFALYEGTEQQMINLAVRWFPEMIWEFIPILQSQKVGEARRKLTKD